MPARKPSTKKSSKKTAARPGIVPLYAVPIYGAIKRGDAAEMKKLAAQARKHISDLVGALAALDKRIGMKK